MMSLFTANIEQYLREVSIPMRLSCISKQGWPVVLSLWYLYHEGYLYCATQETAYVVSCLKHEPKCAFEIAADQPPYCGVRGQGVATIDDTTGWDTLRRLLKRYLGTIDTPLGKRLMAQTHNEVTIKIEPNKIFTWNYANRMQGVPSERPDKICP